MFLHTMSAIRKSQASSQRADDLEEVEPARNNPGVPPEVATTLLNPMDLVEKLKPNVDLSCGQETCVLLH